jgi:hypothetical protein
MSRMRRAICPTATSLFIIFRLCGDSTAATPTTLPATATAPATQPQHGLNGYYFTDRPVDAYSRGIPGGAAAVKRVDARIAFGKDNGFLVNKMHPVWAPPKTTDVIWKGWIHFPKPGTYFLTSVSDDGSSVYLGESRVCLNAGFGGIVPSDAFVYPDAGTQPAMNPASNTYLVPLEITADRLDWPLEIRYFARNMGGTGFGIDLYWVTPDSAKDASGKAIAQIVPTDSLYTAPPATYAAQPKSRTSAASSTLSADVLYMPLDPSAEATLTVRLADADGKPIPGHHVRVSNLVNYGSSDRVIQSTATTDEKGQAQVKVKPTAGYRTEHDSSFFATDLTEMIDVAQVAHLDFRPITRSFMPDTVAPYYDDKFFVVTPLPLVAGQPCTIRVPLKNRSNFDAVLTATFLTNHWNIGGGWGKIGEVAGLKLKPGEERMAQLTWTPGESRHLCFKIDIAGTYLPRAARAQAMVQPVLYTADAMPVADDAKEKPVAGESRQRNLGPVERIKEKIKEKAEDIANNYGIPVLGGTLKKDGRIHYGVPGPTVEVGGHEVFSSGAKADIGAAPGSDASKDIININYSAKVETPFGEKSISGSVGVRISDKVQNDLNPSSTQNPQGRQLAGLDLP